MWNWRSYGAGLVALAGLPASLWAQPAAAVPPAGAPVAAVAPVAAAAPPKTIWQCLGLSKENLKACKDRFCQSQIGLLVNNGLKPASVLSGGLIGSCCPVVRPEDLLRPATEAEGAAARIMKDEAEAKQRRAAVRYLGTVDCHYWPEAEAALIASLRSDRNECVRLEAALALTRGCCCTKPIVEALTITVSGSNKDGNPSENSERVKAQAAVALELCLACVDVTPVQPTEEPPEQPREGLPAPTPAPPAPPNINAHLTPYYRQVQGLAREELAERARRVLASPRVVVGLPVPSPMSQERSVYGVLSSAVGAGPAESGPGRALGLGFADDAGPAGEDVSVVVRAAPLADRGKGPVVRSVFSPLADGPAQSPASGPPPSPVQLAAAVAPPAAAPPQVRPSVQEVIQNVLPAADPPSPGSTEGIRQAMDLLRSSPSADQRQRAAVRLGDLDSRLHPEAVLALVNSACKDPAQAVRTASIRGLARMNATADTVKLALARLTADLDPAVRAEALEAHRRLFSGRSDLASGGR